MRYFLATVSLALLVGVQARAQSPKEQAIVKATEAIKLMDDGHLAESIKLLEEARKLDPDYYSYPYELALAHYQNKEYAVAVGLLEPLLKHPQASDKTYQLLGNSYDLTGDAKKAIATYASGVAKFPSSGPLYLELGNMQLGQKKYQAALDYYEKGIELAPQYPSNYFRAAKLYLNSNTEMWGMLYGELFMNLERNSGRTAEMSKLLYDTYKSEITFPNDSSASVSFAQNVIDASMMKGKKLKLPYSMTYENTLGIAVAVEKSVNIRSLNTIRTNFISTYYAMKYDKEYPNVLFDYQQQIAKAGHAEAYNYWLLMKGDEAGFEQWQKDNPDKWRAFATWYKANPLQLDAKHRFYRMQY